MLWLCAAEDMSKAAIVVYRHMRSKVKYAVKPWYILYRDAIGNAWEQVGRNMEHG